MTHTIKPQEEYPDDLERYLQEQERVQPIVVPAQNPPRIIKTSSLSVDDLINHGKVFYSNQKDSEGKDIGVAIALQEAYEGVGAEGGIATMPYLIAGKAQAVKESYLWKNWFTALSEENAGIDKKGKLARKGQEVVLTLHGVGILTPARIKKAYSEGLTPQNAAKFADEEWDNLLNGVLPSGENIDLYTVDDVKKGIPNPWGRYAVWMPATTAKATAAGYHSKANFMKNELVMARAGTLEHLDAYFEKAQHPKNHNLGNYHRLGEIDFKQHQGRVLFVDNDYCGLIGSGNLNNIGRFVGVAPEAGGAQKQP